MDEATEIGPRLERVAHRLEDRRELLGDLGREHVVGDEPRVLVVGEANDEA